MYQRTAQVLRKTIVLLLMGVLVFSGWFMVRWGVADIFAHQGYEEMDRWDDRYPVTEDRWQFALKRLTGAADLDPGNPVYQQRLSRLYRIRMTRLQATSEFKRDPELALQYIRRSIELRSRWGFSWAELAYLKWLLREKDVEFQAALTHAVAYGPWEPGVIRMVNFIGAREYQNFDEVFRQLLVDNFVRGLRSPTHTVFGDTFGKVKGNERLGTRVSAALYPFLAEPWRGSVRNNFFLLADWAWLEFDETQQVAIIGQTIDVIRGLSTPYSWINTTTNDEFKKALCKSALVDSPQDVNLLEWCGRG
ncbi:MAG: hypothetical protein HN738_11490 [Gammaproteobacteria bacterium]|nr:hypothetical protein [Gammaproteobacteria bacterium]MBT7799047.1 hypothetical protein [Gammaproteobacteria bacterium]MBT7878693.1 hypothetical protein [Gammaproteobacteria bacterium]